MKKEGGKPTAPTVRLETWKSLLDVSLAFRELAPWRWMGDSQMLGIQEGGNDTLRLASVLGAAGEVFGLIVYRGQEGLRCLWRALTREVDYSSPGTLFVPDAIGLDFGPKECLTKEDRTVLKNLKYRSTAQTSFFYPSYRSYLPGYYPWFVNQAEAEMLIADLRRAIDFARLLRKHPDLFEGRDFMEIPFYPEPLNGGNSLTPAALRWEQLIRPPEKEIQPVEIDEVTLERLKGFPVQNEEVWEFIVGFNCATIWEAPRPYYTLTALLVEKRSCYITAVKAGKVGESNSLAAECLTEAICKLGHKPGRIRVKNQDLGNAIGLLCGQAGMKVECATRLPVAEEVFHDLEKHLHGMGPLLT